jgi:hypothetical protein
MVTMIKMVYKQISVQETTKERFLKVLGTLQAETGSSVTEDETVNALLEVWEKNRKEMKA